MSDVMVGAGIGILATEFGYFLADLIFKDKGLHVGETQLVYDRFRRPSFLSFTVGVTTSPGSYLPYPGLRTSFKAGPTVGAQGAWFASPYVGVGGRFAVTNLEMTVNGVPQDDNLEERLGGCRPLPVLSAFRPVAGRVETARRVRIL